MPTVACWAWRSLWGPSTTQHAGGGLALGGVFMVATGFVGFCPAAGWSAAGPGWSPRWDAPVRATLRTMSAVIVEAASVGIPLLGAKLTQKGMAHDPIVSSAMESLAFRPQ